MSEEPLVGAPWAAADAWFGRKRGGMGSCYALRRESRQSWVL